MIIVENKATFDDYKSNLVFDISRTSPIGNPFTYDAKKSSIAKLSFKTREEAIEAYKLYFNEMYGKNKKFTEYFDKIYEAYKTGKTVYLQCWCKPLPCHGDFLEIELGKKLLAEKNYNANNIPIKSHNKS